MIAIVREGKADVQDKSKLDVTIGEFPSRYWRYLLATLLFGIGNSGTAFLILQTSGIGIALVGTVLIYAFYNLIAALVSYPSGRLSDEFGRRNILLAAFAIFIFTYLGFAVTQNIFMIGGLFCLYGLYQGIFR